MNKSIISIFIALLLTISVCFAITTEYGSKGTGTSKYIIVAPHAAGDDLFTGQIAINIANQLSGSYIINTQYQREIEDFNSLSWSSSMQSYLWTYKDPAMTQFYSDISTFADATPENKIVIFIHGMTDKPDTQIDIGIGAAYYNGTLMGTDAHPDAGTNTGEIRLDPALAETLRQQLDNRICTESTGDATIGQYYTAWSSNNGIQYLRNTPHSSMQLEIGYSLRADTLKTSRTIAKSIKATFG